ncbi:hypothetical protein [Shewanella surugensis]|uniref:Tyrosine specific protein phosphatases domain-containing protein n=1 Tax=Shewanella surugensis TaxID=212020 RepID=A0ABT0LAC4_9GAMM|nr:hypothetical protein [Shewanella surugensis]MCL1124669.1 hypothetical protein [Shewanella surugensis]
MLFGSSLSALSSTASSIWSSVTSSVFGSASNHEASGVTQEAPSPLAPSNNSHSGFDINSSVPLSVASVLTQQTESEEQAVNSRVFLANSQLQQMAQQQPVMDISVMTLAEIKGGTSSSVARLMDTMLPQQCGTQFSAWCIEEEFDNELLYEGLSDGSGDYEQFDDIAKQMGISSQRLALCYMRLLASVSTSNTELMVNNLKANDAPSVAEIIDKMLPSECGSLFSQWCEEEEFDNEALYNTFTDGSGDYDDFDEIAEKIGVSTERLAQCYSTLLTLAKKTELSEQEVSRFNARMAPSGMLMSTRRPSSIGNSGLEGYRDFLTSQKIDTLISIGANSSATLPDILARAGITHIDDEAFHITDFFKENALPVETLKAVTEKLAILEAQGLKVAIHCGAGDGRSGIVKAAYELSQLTQEELLAVNNKATAIIHVGGVDDDDDEDEDVSEAPQDVRAFKAVCNAINGVRAEGHSAAIERETDIKALDAFYLHLCVQAEAAQEK